MSDETEIDIEAAKERLRDAVRMSQKEYAHRVNVEARILQAYSYLGGDTMDIREIINHE